MLGNPDKISSMPVTWKTGRVTRKIVWSISCGNYNGSLHQAHRAPRQYQNSTEHRRFCISVVIIGRKTSGTAAKHLLHFGEELYFAIASNSNSFRNSTYNLIDCTLLSAPAANPKTDILSGMQSENRASGFFYIDHDMPRNQHTTCRATNTPVTHGCFDPGLFRLTACLLSHDHADWSKPKCVVECWRWSAKESPLYLHKNEPRKLCP